MKIAIKSKISFLLWLKSEGFKVERSDAGIVIILKNKEMLLFDPDDGVTVPRQVEPLLVRFLKHHDEADI